MPEALPFEIDKYHKPNAESHLQQTGREYRRFASHNVGYRTC